MYIGSHSNKCISIAHKVQISLEEGSTVTANNINISVYVGADQLFSIRPDAHQAKHHNSILLSHFSGPS